MKRLVLLTKWFFYVALIGAALLLSGCGLLDDLINAGAQYAGGGTSVSILSPEEFDRAVKATIAAITEAALNNPSETSSADGTHSSETPSPEVLTAQAETLTAAVLPDTETPSPTRTKRPTKTPPAETPTPDFTPTIMEMPEGYIPPPTETPCLEARFIAHVTISPGTLIQGGETFYKTWRIQNVGSCAWGADFAIVYDGGLQMKGRSPLPLGVTISSGQYVNITQYFQAPPQSGKFISLWALKHPSGRVFGVGQNFDEPLSLEIIVSGDNFVTTPILPGPISTDPGFTPSP